MRGSSSLLALALGAALPVAVLLAPLSARAQQPAPATVWPDPPSARPAAAPPSPAQPAAPAQPRRPAPPAAQAPADPAAAPPVPSVPAAQARPRRADPPLNVRCDGPFAKDGSHDKLAATFGAKNVVAQGTGGSTIVFPTDPKRRLEVTWHDAAARQRPAAIIIEGQSTWRARGFRIGEPLANVEKTNGQPFVLMGFTGEAGGSAKNWQGGALDKLSGGCQLGMRFAPAPNTPADARAKVSNEGDLVSGSPEVRAVKPMIAELIVGYPE